MIENLLFQFIYMSVEYLIYNIFINIKLILAKIKILKFFYEVLFSNLFIDYLFFNIHEDNMLDHCTVIQLFT